MHRDMFWLAAHGHADSHAAVKSHSNPEGIVIHTTKNLPVAIMGNPESAKDGRVFGIGTDGGGEKQMPAVILMMEPALFFRDNYQLFL